MLICINANMGMFLSNMGITVNICPRKNNTGNMNTDNIVNMDTLDGSNSMDICPNTSNMSTDTCLDMNNNHMDTCPNTSRNRMSTCPNTGIDLSTSIYRDLNASSIGMGTYPNNMDTDTWMNMNNMDTHTLSNMSMGNTVSTGNLRVMLRCHPNQRQESEKKMTIRYNKY